MIGILNELLAVESANLLPRLAESNAFISWASADEVESVGRMVAEERAHVEWLVELILDLRGSPGPRVGTIDAAALHYVELHALLPRIERAEADVLKRYETLAPALGAEPRAAALVSRITARHREHLEQLRRIMRDHTVTSKV
ncbi:MAG TPA: hypothetical protein VGM03_21385 [Phycisphaerae bacterium]